MWGAHDVDVESSLMGGLAEMQDRDRPQKGGRGLKGLMRKKKLILVIAVFLGILFLILGSVFGDMGSAKRRAAEELCHTMKSEETQINVAGEWMGWAGAVKKVYLAHNEPAGTLLASDQESEALHCAKLGWQSACTEKLFGKDSPLQQSEVQEIVQDRRSLEQEYTKAMSDIPEPEANRLRFPAGIALRVKRGIANAELAVCNMPPVDKTCIGARSEEVKAIDALSMQLRKVVNQAAGKGGRLVANLAVDGEPVELLKKLAKLIRLQKVHDVVRHRTWRTLNAVSAVILYQTLEGLRDDGEKIREDVMLFENSDKLQYVGGFSGLQYHGKGTLFYRDGTIAYAGDWKYGKLCE